MARQFEVAGLAASGVVDFDVERHITLFGRMVITLQSSRLWMIVAFQVRRRPLPSLVSQIGCQEIEAILTTDCRGDDFECNALWLGVASEGETAKWFVTHCNTETGIFNLFWKAKEPPVLGM